MLALPARSPQANPIEDLWRQLKNKVAANLNRSLDALKVASTPSKKRADGSSISSRKSRPYGRPDSILVNFLVCPYLETYFSNFR